VTEAEKLEFDVLRAVIIAKARQRWRKKMMGRSVGPWIMVYRSEW
jgi:hypothetical protein